MKLLLVALASVAFTAQGAAIECSLNPLYAVAAPVTGCTFNTSYYSFNDTLAAHFTACTTVNVATDCCAQYPNGLSVTCAAGTALAAGTSPAVSDCSSSYNWNGVNFSQTPFQCGLTAAVCFVNCTSVNGGTCATSTGSTIVVGTATQVYSSNSSTAITIACGSGSSPATTTGASCTNQSTISLTCVGNSVSGLTSAQIGVIAKTFTDQGQLTTWLIAAGLAYSVSTASVTCLNSESTACEVLESAGEVVCSLCFQGTRRVVVVAGVGIVIVICPQASVAGQQACFRAAVCSGLLRGALGCGVGGVGTCPRCSHSKKGLLGLLGLLGIIPAVLCSSLLCLLLLCCIRRKKSEQAVNFATFDAGVAAAPALTMHGGPALSHCHGVDPHAFGVAPGFTHHGLV